MNTPSTMQSGSNPTDSQADELKRRREVYDTEIFKIIEGALRSQGVSKPITDEFYRSVIEADDYIKLFARRHTTEVLKDLKQQIRNQWWEDRTDGRLQINVVIDAAIKKEEQ